MDNYTVKNIKFSPSIYKFLAVAPRYNSSQYFFLLDMSFDKSTVELYFIIALGYNQVGLKNRKSYNQVCTQILYFIYIYMYYFFIIKKLEIYIYNKK